MASVGVLVGDFALDHEPRFSVGRSPAMTGLARLFDLSYALSMACRATAIALTACFLDCQRDSIAAGD